ncbi:hypothetical protein [Agromyces laixinhei]|uniref:hypothetical protein n=1 Tax=Agromyces laixinhei TaxID=2585717 RepID=UPI001E6095B0|nr:hypothetical protein [Agromyces laixinhei]
MTTAPTAIEDDPASPQARPSNLSPAYLRMELNTLPYWLTSPQLLRVSRESIVHDATIEWQLIEDYRWAVSIVCPAFGTAEARANDAFEALCLVREQLEPYGWRIGLAGSQVDVWPSGMARDQGGGLVAYRFDAPDLVEVFQPVDPETVTTVTEQQAAAEVHYGGRMREMPNT